MWHAVFAGGGGKRLRPVLLLTVGADLGVPVDLALPAALALELVHNYSLVHDDLPCMDNADLRRGLPSVHAAFGYGDAVLAGDALLTHAFEVLGRAANSGLPRPGELVVELARAAGSVGMVGGQCADLAPDLSVAAALPGTDDPILKMQLMKTSKLYGFAFAAPAHLSGASREDIEALRAAGESFGLTFQLADDIRDAAEDDRPGNFARAAGPAKARRTALGALGACEAVIVEKMGRGAQTLALVRGAAREMGL
jgi:geranylgeranyl pyrophosphate synthase